MVLAEPLGTGIEGAADIDAWASGFGKRLSREVAWLAERVQRISPNAIARGAVTIAVVDGPGDALSAEYIVLKLSEAIRVAAMPLRILVEDGLSEAAFFRRAMPQSWREKLSHWEETGAIQFEHGGGVGGITRLIDRCADGSHSNPLGLPAEAWRISQVIVSDRDSKDTSGGMSKDVLALCRACDKASMKGRLHVLWRRCQESYIPKEALEAIVASKTDAAERQEMLLKIDTQFADAAARLHKPLPRIGERSWFKSAFLEYENSDVNWNDEWFERDNSSTELIELAEMIAAFL
jgi:hypothetical protein